MNVYTQCLNVCDCVWMFIWTTDGNDKYMDVYGCVQMIVYTISRNDIYRRIYFFYCIDKLFTTVVSIEIY